MGSIASGIGAGIGGMAGGLPGMLIGGSAGGGGVLGNALYHPNNPYFVDPGPRPDYQGYTGIRDPNTGLLQQSGLNAQVGATGPGYQAFQDRALAAPGTSAWEQMALGKQQLEQQQAAQQAMQSGQARAAEARGGIARRGGLTSGAQERVAKSSMRDILGAKQTVAQGGQQARADIGLNAENQRLAALSQLPGMESQRQNQQIGVQEFNIQNALAQKQAEEQAKQQEYQQKMAAYAAAQQANAIAASGPKSGGLFGQSGLFGGLIGG
jgi:hypothetical protein